MNAFQETFYLTFTRAAWCEKYATLSLPDNWPDCCTTAYEYVIGEPLDYYDVPEFQITESDCDIAYTATSDLDGTGLLTERQEGRGMEWYSLTDLTHANKVFTITVTATAGCSLTESVQYTLTTFEPEPEDCSSAEIVISELPQDIHYLNSGTYTYGDNSGTIYST